MTFGTLSYSRGIFLLVVTFVGLWLLPLDPLTQNLENRLALPSFQHYFGTDELGRDLFARVLKGMQSSLYISFLSSGIAAGLGLVLGMVGAIRKPFSRLLVVVSDIILSIPGIILILLFLSVLGPGKASLIIALSIVYLPLCSRLAYVEAKKLLGADFIAASYSFGASWWWVSSQHLVRSLIATMLVQWATLVGVSIQVEASLSFLGIGVRIPEPSLGLLLNTAQRYIYTAPWLFVFPGMALLGMVGGFFFLTDRRRKAMPRMASPIV